MTFTRSLIKEISIIVDKCIHYISLQKPQNRKHNKTTIYYSTLSLLSPKIEKHQLVQFGGKQLLGILSKSDTNVSLPRHGSKHGMCVSKSAECVSFHPTCHDVEMDETEQGKSANARKHQVPESMHLTDDRNKREREINCYVDEPSKMIGATPIPTLSPAVSPVIVLTTPSEDNQFTET